MKHTLMLLSAFCLLLSACSPGARFTVETIHTTPAAKLPPTAPNVSVSQLAINAVYLSAKTEFSIHRQGRCAVLELDGNPPREVPAEVYQTLPGVFMADFGCGDFLKINTVEGWSHIQFGSINRTYNR
jgi:hypothetical protein